jgi:hypothetical protein
MKRFGQMRSLLFIALLALAPAAHADNNAPAPAAKPAATPAAGTAAVAKPAKPAAPAGK